MNKILLFIYITVLVFFISCENKESKTEKNNYKNVRENGYKSVQLTSRQLENLKLEQLRILRNEIFARHGYIFNSHDLKEYFSSKSWYKPQFKNVNKFLNSTDSANISLIIQFEKALKAKLPKTLKTDTVLINDLKYLSESKNEQTKRIALFTIELMEKFKNKIADTIIYQINQFDGIDGLDTLKNRIRVFRSHVQVNTTLIKNKKEIWWHNYDDPYLWLEGYEETGINNESQWVLFSIGILYGPPDIQNIKPTFINHSLEDEKFKAYLESFSGVYIIPGQPESRDGLFVWDEPNKSFRLIYTP